MTYQATFCLLALWLIGVTGCVKGMAPTPGHGLFTETSTNDYMAGSIPTTYAYLHGPGTLQRHASGLILSLLCAFLAPSLPLFSDF